MTEQEARRIAETELRRINELLDLDVEIESAVGVSDLWIFNTIGRGSEPERPQHLKGIAVHANGRVNTSLTVARPDEQLAKFRASLATTDDLRWLIPRNKGDFDRVNAVMARGYPAVMPILPDLLIWLRDMNWPIAAKLSEFIAGIGAPLAPHLRAIFDGDDYVWKYWLIGRRHWLQRCALRPFQGRTEAHRHQSDAGGAARRARRTCARSSGEPAGHCRGSIRAGETPALPEDQRFGTPSP